MELKLSSNSVYITFAIPLVLLVGLPVAIANYGMSPFGALIFLLPAGFWVYFVARSRRVYYRDSSLYLYGLFSNNHQIITKDKLGSIGRWRELDYTNYKILYYDDDNNAKTIYFMKNWFLASFDTIIDQLNEID